MSSVLLVGSAMMIVSLAITILLFAAASRLLFWLSDSKTTGWPQMAAAFNLAIASLWILVVLTGSVWGWALLYMALGLFDTLEPALYFSIVSFTTVGYGDVVLAPGWRLLAGMTATHGLLTFGLFTAFLVEVFNLPARTRAKT